MTVPARKGQRAEVEVLRPPTQDCGVQGDHGAPAPQLSARLMIESTSASSVDQ